MRRFFVDRPAGPGTVYTIENPDANHIRNVLRMKPGDGLHLFDGTGHEFTGRLIDLSDDTVTVEITDIFTCSNDSPLRITIGQALLKNKKMDTTLRQLTELGMDGWLPVETERSVPKVKEKREPSKSDRWQIIVRESVKQCQRGFVPEIYPPVDFRQALEFGRRHDLNLIFSDGEGETLDRIRARVSQVQTVFLLLGPEGGFSPREIELARQNDFIPAGLGPRILKADTASVAACAIVQSLFGDMRGKD